MSFFLPGQTILFQGDSITNAFRRPEEPSDAYQLGAGYALLIAAQLKAARPRDDLRFVNRGVSGDGLGELSARWQSDCLDLRPDVLSLLVGVNATIRKFGGSSQTCDFDFEDFARLYDDLLERTRGALPEVQLVLCEPFLLPCGQVTHEWMDDIRGRAQKVRELAPRWNARFVPLQSRFDEACQSAPPEYWAYDGIHPTAAGHHLLAQSWLEATE